jgi:hypothetical protein
MKTKFIYNIEGAEKIVNKTQIESGDTIDWANAQTLVEAKSKANTMLKRKDIFSVWIYKFSVSEIYGDPLCQWVRYDGDKWKTNFGW